MVKEMDMELSSFQMAVDTKAISAVAVKMDSD